MAEQTPNFTCKYSGCHLGENGTPKEYYACAECIRIKPWKEVGCCVEHGLAYQNEVAFARMQEIPYPELKDMMIKDGVINGTEKSKDSNTKITKTKSDDKSDDVK